MGKESIDAIDSIKRTTQNVNNNTRLAQRRLLREKLRHKRKIVFGIWAIVFAYLSFTADSAPHPSDELDTMPLSRGIQFSPGTFAVKLHICNPKITF